MNHTYEIEFSGGHVATVSAKALEAVDVMAIHLRGLFGEVIEGVKILWERTDKGDSRMSRKDMNLLLEHRRKHKVECRPWR